MIQTSTSKANKPVPIRMGPQYRSILMKTAGAVTLLILWWLASVALPPSILPGPLLVSAAFVENLMDGVLLKHLTATMGRVLPGFVLALSGGILFGSLMGLSKRSEEFLELWMMVGLTIPSLAILLVCFIVFGLNEYSTILAIGLSSFPSIAINIWQGVKNVDNKLLAMARVFNVSNSRRFRQVIFPQIAPYLMASARFGLGLVWKITVIAELLGRNSGIGFQMHYWFQLFNMAQVFAWTLFFTIVMLFIELCVFKPLENRLFRWRPATKF